MIVWSLSHTSDQISLMFLGTVMSGKISDTSQFVKFEWIEWVMLQDETASYPEKHFTQIPGAGHRCWSCYDRKILTRNCHVFHRSRYHALTYEEWEIEKHKGEHITYMESIHQRMGPQAMVDDLLDLGA